MVSNSGNRWAIAASTFAVWGLVAASGVYWALKLINTPPPAMAAASVRSAPPADPAAIARLLGSTPATASPAVSVASRFNLLGVVAESGGGGAALIAVDGKPAKPYRIGAPIDENLVLRSVEPRRVTLAASTQAQPAITLEMPVRR